VLRVGGCGYVFAFRAGAVVVEVGAQVVEAGLGIGEQVSDDDQDGAADRNDGSLLAAAPCDAPVALPEEGAGLPGGHRGFPERAGQVAVAVPGGALAFLAACGVPEVGLRL
jgi:hypothetical protein